MGTRLGDLLKARGVRQNALAGVLDVDPPRVSKWVRGELAIPLEYVERIAKHLQVPPGSILGWEGGTGLVHTARLVGYAGVGAMVYFDPHAGAWGTVREVPAPLGVDGLRALLVSGGALGDVYDDGTLLFFRDGEPPSDRLIGRRCVVQLRAGQPCVRRLIRGERAGTYALEWPQMERIEAPDIEWVAPILYTQEAT